MNPVQPAVPAHLHTRHVRTPLVLSENPVHRRKLLQKFAEYVGRCGYPAPKPDADIEIVLRCILIERLFTHSVVDPDAFDKEHSDVAWFNLQASHHAASIVDSYNSGRIS